MHGVSTLPWGTFWVWNCADIKPLTSWSLRACSPRTGLEWPHRDQHLCPTAVPQQEYLWTRPLSCTNGNFRNLILSHLKLSLSETLLSEPKLLSLQNEFDAVKEAVLTQWVKLLVSSPFAFVSEKSCHLQEVHTMVKHNTLFFVSGGGQVSVEWSNSRRWILLESSGHFYVQGVKFAEIQIPESTPPPHPHKTEQILGCWKNSKPWSWNGLPHKEEGHARVFQTQKRSDHK